MTLTRLSTLLTGTISALLLLYGASWAGISRGIVSEAWRKITEADNFRRVPINYENDSEPNAWVIFQDEENFTVHVTAGLMKILETEDEIAGVLGHELGHIRLGHYAGMLLSDTARAIMDINSEIADEISQAVSKTNMDLHESAFSRKQETEADDYGVKLLKRAGYNSWGLYNAMNRFDVTEHSGFNSHPATRERLAHLADMAENFHGRESLDDIADIIMGQ